MFDDGIEDLLQIVSFTTQFFFAPAVSTGTVEDGEIEGFIIRFKADEQVEDLIHHFGWSTIGAIRLVDDDHRFEIVFESLLQDEAGLWHRSIKGVNEQQHSVSHRKNPLHLATKVGVARGVDDVDAIGGFSTLHLDGTVFGENGDATFPLEGVAVEDQAMLASGESVQFLIAEHS